MHETSSELEKKVAQLCAAGDIIAAGEVLSDAGQHLRASRLYEQACVFERAARAAASAEDHVEGVRLAVLSGNAALLEQLSTQLLAYETPARARYVADGMVARGAHREAAALLEKIGDFPAAAESYQRAGQAALAASAYARAGQPAPAARVLEAALRGGVHDEHALRVQLGELYARHGKHRAAVRVLQQIPESSIQRGQALRVLAAGLEALGLLQARRDLDDELERHDMELVSNKPNAQACGTEKTVLFGRYRVVREVATTPHARLLEAVDELSGDRVALKILASRMRGTGRDALGRFVREVRALQKLRHANVVPIRDFIEEGPAMVLSWMGGGSLRDLLDREEVSPARAAEIVRAVLDALFEAHRLGILHRDIKPSNLLFDDGGTARLADFGAAHLADGSATVTVGAIGTVAYMSPEQRVGHKASVESDLYGVGVLFHEMLTGELPPPERPLSVKPFHPEFRDEHDAIINKLVAESRDARYHSALDARRAIEATNWATRRLGRAVPRSNERDAVATDVMPTERSQARRTAGDQHDTWLGRDVHVLGLDENLTRAATYARADHASLATILRADVQTREIWIEVMPGRPLSQGLSLSASQRVELREALAALHRVGGVHGAVDSEHVFVHAGRARLAFATACHDVHAAADIAALAALPGHRPTMPT